MTWLEALATHGPPLFLCLFMLAISALVLAFAYRVWKDGDL